MAGTAKSVLLTLPIPKTNLTVFCPFTYLGLGNIAHFHLVTEFNKNDLLLYEKECYVLKFKKSVNNFYFSVYF